MRYFNIIYDNSPHPSIFILWFDFFLFLSTVTPLTFKSNPQPVTGYIGGAVRLSVDVSDFVPAPQVAWLNRGGSRVSDAKYTALPQGVIQINDLSEANKGEIQAVAQNPIDKTQIRSQFAKITIEPGLFCQIIRDFKVFRWIFISRFCKRYPPWGKSMLYCGWISSIM